MKRLAAVLVFLCVVALILGIVGKGVAAMIDERVGLALKAFGERYGAVVAYDQVSFVSLSGITIRGLKISLPGAEPFLAVDRVTAGANLFSYLKGDPCITGFAADEVELVLRRDTGGVWEVTRLKRKAGADTRPGHGLMAWPLELEAEDIRLELKLPADSSAREIGELEGEIDLPGRRWRVEMWHVAERLAAAGRGDSGWCVDFQTESVQVACAAPLIGRLLDLSAAEITCSGQARFRGRDEFAAAATGTLDNFGVSHALLARRAATGISFGFGFDLASRDGTIEVRSAHLALARESVTLNGTIARPFSRPIVDLLARFDRFDLGRAADNLPRSLLPHLGELKVTGTVDGDFHLCLDAARPQTLDYAFRGTLDSFAILGLGPAVDIEALNRPFRHVALLPEGETREILVGPEGRGFVPLAAVPEAVIDAVLTAEDGSFFVHHGFSPRHIHEAIVANLEAGRVVRGASTITMQLAKNLFLSRERTLSRKIEEAFITLALEERLPKRRLLEIYLNIIEWGPGVFGIGPAARHYFDKPASELTPVEGAFLASIIARPTHGWGRDPLASIGDGWWNYLRVILCKMFRRGHIDAMVLKEAGVPDAEILAALGGDTALELLPLLTPPEPAGGEAHPATAY